MSSILLDEKTKILPLLHVIFTTIVFNAYNFAISASLKGSSHLNFMLELRWPSCFQRVLEAFCRTYLFRYRRTLTEIILCAMSAAKFGIKAQKLPSCEAFL